MHVCFSHCNTLKYNQVLLKFLLSIFSLKSFSRNETLFGGNFRVGKTLEPWHIAITTESDNDSKPFSFRQYCNLLMNPILSFSRVSSAINCNFFFFTRLLYTFQQSPFLFTICQRSQTETREIVVLNLFYFLPDNVFK